MIGYIALILLLAFCYSYFKDIFINEDTKLFDNNYTKLTAPKHLYCIAPARNGLGIDSNWKSKK